jgi:exodeoxyribonuclease VII small subunit
MAKSARSSTEPAFETALAELEAIVARMEEGRLGLEESMQSYRRGAELVRYCQSKLSDAEQQVRILDADLLKPFADESSES